MRTRRSLRPRLDAMENRIALSGLNAQSLVSAIHLPFLNQQKPQHHAAQPDAHPNRHRAARPRRHPNHHAVLVHTHAHAHPKPKPKSSSSSSNIFSQFFKSAFGGL